VFKEFLRYYFFVGLIISFSMQVVVTVFYDTADMSLYENINGRIVLFLLYLFGYPVALPLLIAFFIQRR